MHRPLLILPLLLAMALPSTAAEPSPLDPHVVPLLQGLLADARMRGPALRGLATFADDKTPGLILKLYPTLTEAEKGDAVTTLAARPAYAQALVKAVEDGKVPPGDLNNF